MANAPQSIIELALLVSVALVAASLLRSRCSLWVRVRFQVRTVHTITDRVTMTVTAAAAVSVTVMLQSSIRSDQEWNRQANALSLCRQNTHGDDAPECTEVMQLAGGPRLVKPVYNAAAAFGGSCRSILPGSGNYIMASDAGMSRFAGRLWSRCRLGLPPPLELTP